ncbi:MAG: acyl-CoA dehydrogenase family protein [Acidimicrobiales bacterium]
MTTVEVVAADTAGSVDERLDALLAEVSPATTAERDFLGARFDRGLAWVHLPVGRGGLGADIADTSRVHARLAAAHAPNPSVRNLIGVEMLAPTLAQYGTEQQLDRFLRPAFVGDEIWCQLFSEPEAGSDLASLGTKAVRRGETWVVTGQKVWTTLAHLADWALCLVRTGAADSRHRGLTMLAVDMRSPGVEVRPLRQISGEAEYNEVFLTDVAVPDAMRIGEQGEGWRVATATLSSERAVVSEMAKGAAMAALRRRLLDAWATADASRRTPAWRDRVVRLLGDSTIIRFTAERGDLPPSMGKIQYGELAQRISSLCVDLAGPAGTLIDTYDQTVPTTFTHVGGEADATVDPAKGLLVSQALTIAGGTTNINKNVLAERVLGLPPEPRRTS